MQVHKSLIPCRLAKLDTNLRRTDDYGSGAYRAVHDVRRVQALHSRHNLSKIINRSIWPQFSNRAKEIFESLPTTSFGDNDQRPSLG